MSLRSIVFSSLFCLSISVPVLAIGCAAPTGSEDDSADRSAESEDELTAGASQLVGSYYTHAPGVGGFARLELKANGKYSGHVDGAGKIVCVASPCLLPESGTWNASKHASGGFRLRVTPAGKGSRSYEATKSSGPPVLELTRAGVTTKLNKLASNQCLDNADCTAAEECGPKLCLMYCAAGDPFCCGPSTCKPKAPPPSCAGAWLDPLGGCRGLADGSLPATCCAGLTTPCGPNPCGVGESCCNALDGICTPPGFACTQ